VLAKAAAQACFVAAEALKVNSRAYFVAAEVFEIDTILAYQVADVAARACCMGTEPEVVEICGNGRWKSWSKKQFKDAVHCASELCSAVSAPLCSVYEHTHTFQSDIDVSR